VVARHAGQALREDSHVGDETVVLRAEALGRFEVPHDPRVVEIVRRVHLDTHLDVVALGDRHGLGHDLGDTMHSARTTLQPSFAA
jgi:hypothetical protein